MILVSACLAGVECRYNGSSHTIPEVVEMVKKGDAMPICPEILAGLPIPRPPAEQQNGMIISSNGDDQTADYLLGATIALYYNALISFISIATFSSFVAQLVQNLTTLCSASTFSQKEYEYFLLNFLSAASGKMGNC
ncbi:MAG: hypothetical protein H6Q72_2947 [Firmicutes bacterium]|nr:hypothetical protein [Bacillota bacterium]